MKRKILENVFDVLYTGFVIGIAMVLFYFLMMGVMVPLVAWLVW